MANELIIHAGKLGIQLALLTDRKLIELHQERNNEQFSVGDVYMGVVKKLMPSLNAAFINVGHEKDAFLHYLDLGPQIKTLLKYRAHVQQSNERKIELKNITSEEDILKTGKISDILKKGMLIPVQVVKEPISSKGPRLSSEISLPGRYVVMVPFSNQISISKKIKTFEERTRLKNLAKSIKPADFGLIVRTVAEGASAAELHADILDLEKKWKELEKGFKTDKAPTRILSEMNRVSSLLRDILSDDFSNITTDHPTLYHEIKSYIQQISPDKVGIVHLYNNNKITVFEHFGIDKQIKLNFGKTVSMHGGSYLIIEHTEACHVIDVNSGSKKNTEESQDDNALKVNLDSATEIARQLRLRDMGGLVLVDFIDLKSAVSRKKVYEKLKEEMKSDRAKHSILPLSKFGVMEITRQRVRPEITVDITENCPMCDGTGKIGPSSFIINDIEEKIEYLKSNLNVKSLQLTVHPYVYAYLTKGIISLKNRMVWKYKVKLNLIEDDHLHIGQYIFSHKNGEEIVL